PRPLRSRAARGRAARRTDLPHGRAPRGAERSAAGESGAGGEAMTAAVRRTGGRAVGLARTGLALGTAAALLSASPPDRLSAQVDRSKPPTLPPPPALKLPAIQTATLPNGLTLAVVERSEERRVGKGSRAR